MDETYAEDSFVVGSDVEEVQSGEEDVELMPEDSYVDGRRQYATRRRVFLHKARAGAKIGAEAPPEQQAGAKTKRTRLMRINDSSDEDTEKDSEKKKLMAGGNISVSLHTKVIQPELSKLQQQCQTPPSSCTIASKVSLLSKAKRSSETEEQQNER